MDQSSFEYQATFKSYIKFDIPYKLENTNVVKEWYIKNGTLYLLLVSGEDFTFEGLELSVDDPDTMYNEDGEDIL